MQQQNPTETVFILSLKYEIFVIDNFDWQPL